MRGIGHLRALVRLDIGYNQIVSVDSLRPLSALAGLRELVLRGNPVASQNRLILYIHVLMY